MSKRLHRQVTPEPAGVTTGQLTFHPAHLAILCDGHGEAMFVIIEGDSE